MTKRLQNKIAESRFALPVTTVYVLAIWLAGGLISRQLYAQLALFGVSAYLMVELNNSNSLIRIYSRMVSCAFLALTTMCAFMFKDLGTWIVQLCMIAAYTTLFRCYQDKRAQGMVFYAFFFLGIASVFFIQILFFIPFLWVVMAANLMAFSSRALWASILGITAPYWFLSGFYVFTGDIGQLARHISGITQFGPLSVPDFANGHTVVTFAFITALAATGVIHFLRNSYKDKIRTRMIYEMLITMNAVTFVFIILQPQHIEPLMSIMTVNTSILTAHYLALTHTRLTNISFCLILLATVLLTIYNLWIPSLAF